jgi:hypothetical protein
MAVQFFEPTPREPSVGQRLSNALGTGIQGLGQIQQQYQQQEAQRRALENFGIDPSATALPENAQAAFFKQKFAPEKQMTPLQLAQQALAEERLKALKQQQNVFGKFFGDGQQEMTDGGTQATQTQEPLDLSKVPEEKLRQGAAFAGQPGQMGIYGNMYKAELEKKEKENKERTAKEREYFKLNEPKVIELSETSNKLQMENARYERLGELFSDPSKFPSSFTAALFSKEGQINDLVYSQLTPEAQEAIKLIVDSTSNIKETYGARVTNFDLQTYLRKLPSLMNTPEGKMRVLRDLQVMNKLNELHAQGIMDVFDEAGGTDKIPYSTAKKLYKKKYGALERQLIEQFVHPEKGTFTDMPEPQKHLGRKIQNPETGEVFISDGVEWKPFKG